MNNFYYTFNCKFEEICKEFLDEILDKIYIIKYKNPTKACASLKTTQPERARDRRCRKETQFLNVL